MVARLTRNVGQSMASGLLNATKGHHHRQRRGKQDGFRQSALGATGRFANCRLGKLTGLTARKSLLVKRTQTLP